MRKLRVDDWAWITEENGRDAQLPTGTLMEVTRVDKSDPIIPYEAKPLLHIDEDAPYWFFPNDLELAYSPEEVQRAPTTKKKAPVSDAESGVSKP